MSCDICHRNIGHHSRCPMNAIVSSKHVCVVCNDPLLHGEEYIVNTTGEYAHWECISGRKDLLEFLEFEIKRYEEE